MPKPTIKELIEQFKPQQAEPFVDEVVANWPEYAPMREFLIGFVNREIHRPKER